MRLFRTLFDFLLHTVDLGDRHNQSQLGICVKWTTVLLLRVRCNGHGDDRSVVLWRASTFIDAVLWRHSHDIGQLRVPV